MPWIHRRTDRVALGAVGGVADNVMKRPVRCKRADVELANGVTQAVAPIAGPVRITSVGRFRHPDADKACGNGSTRKLESGRTASAIGYKAARKGDPRASGWFAHGVAALPNGQCPGAGHDAARGRAAQDALHLVQRHAGPDALEGVRIDRVSPSVSRE